MAARISLLLAVALVGALDAQAGAGEESRLQVSRDRSKTLVDKSVGNERWLISYDQVVGAVRGNVFLGTDETPRFVDCGQVAAEVSRVTFACYGADPCPKAPCTGDEWRYLGDVSLPRSFFAPVDADPVVPACNDWSGNWRVNVGYRSGAFGFGLEASAIQQGCGYELTVGGVGIAYGYINADAASITLYTDTSAGPCTLTGYGAADALAFGFVFAETCAEQILTMGGRRVR